MKKVFKGKAGTAVILVFTLILAGIAIFTAVRLYQLRQQPVAPNVPSSIPKAQEASPTPGACSLSFTISGALTCQPETGTTWCSNHGGIAKTVDHDVVTWSQCLTWCKTNMTEASPLCQYNADGPRNCWINNAPTGGISACTWETGAPPYGSCYQSTSTPTPTPTPAGCNVSCNSTVNPPISCQGSLVCNPTSSLDGASGLCRNAACLNETDCLCATPTPTPNPSGTPNTCGGTCGSNSNCVSDKICYQGFCRNPSCVTSQNCVCAPTSPAGSTPTITPTPPTLPQSGTSWPTILGAGMGTLIILGAILLAL
jgi:hypothetical protein